MKEKELRLNHHEKFKKQLAKRAALALHSSFDMSVCEQLVMDAISSYEGKFYKDEIERRRSKKFDLV